MTTGKTPTKPFNSVHGKPREERWYKVTYYTTMEPPKDLLEADRYMPKGAGEPFKIEDLSVFEYQSSQDKEYTRERPTTEDIVGDGRDGDLHIKDPQATSVHDEWEKDKNKCKCVYKKDGLVVGRCLRCVKMMIEHTDKALAKQRKAILDEAENKVKIITRYTAHQVSYNAYEKCKKDVLSVLEQLRTKGEKESKEE